MKKCIFLLVAGLIVVTQGCSSESAKRLSFESLQGLREQECNKDFTGNCPPRESYDDYQRKRKEALDPENDHKEALPASVGQ